MHELEDHTAGLRLNEEADVVLALLQIIIKAIWVPCRPENALVSQYFTRTVVV